jgi:hypothetical protein
MLMTARGLALSPAAALRLLPGRLRTVADFATEVIAAGS